MSNGELALNNYYLLRCDAENRHTGGVVIYCHNSVSAHCVYKYAQKNIWAYAIVITKGFVSECFCCVYRGHKAQSDDFEIFFSEMCEILMDQKCKVNIFGDINYDLYKCANAKGILKIAKKFNLKQLINEPTRVDKNSSSTIDWFLTSNKSVKCSILENLQLTDHKIIIADFFYRKRDFTKVKSLCWKHYTSDALISNISRVEWSSVKSMSNADHISEFIIANLNKCLNPLLSYKYSSKASSVKWYNPYLDSLRKIKISLYVEWKSLKTPEKWTAYTKARNKYKNELVSAERKFLQSELDRNKYQPKLLWKTLKSIYADDKDSNFRSVKIDDHFYHEPKSISDGLNNYFVKSIEELRDSIPQIAPMNDSMNDTLTQNYTRMTFRDVTLEELNSYLGEIRNSTFIDHLNGKVWIDAAKNSDFMDALLYFINLSLRSGIVPNNLKISCIDPIRKVPNTVLCEELRPINKLPVLEKIIEKCVKTQLDEHLKSNEILIAEQSGFRANHSCETALNSIILEWKPALDKNLYIISVFLDLKKAFETIDRELLMQALIEINCSDNVLNWFTSYLQSRHQFTKIHDSLSELIENQYGIPQGSVLSCYLFLIFINKFKNVLKFSKIKLFADDSLLYLFCDNIDEGIDIMNKELVNVFKYLCGAKLFLNIKKSNYMIVHNKGASCLFTKSIEIHGQKLQRVSEIKYLGVYLDENLSWSAHHINVCKKLNKKFFVLKRCGDKLNCASRILYYNSLVKPVFDYCATINFLFNEGQLNDLQLIQNRYMRYILKMGNRTSISFMLDALQWLSVKEQLIYRTLFFIRKIEIGHCPTYLSSHLVRRHQLHAHNVRSGAHYSIVRCRKASTHNQLFVKGLRLYNNFIDKYKITTETPQRTFKESLIKFIPTASETSPL